MSIAFKGLCSHCNKPSTLHGFGGICPTCHDQILATPKANWFDAMLCRVFHHNHSRMFRDEQGDYQRCLDCGRRIPAPQ